MTDIGIFYGTNQGNTRRVAERVRLALGEPPADLIDAADAHPSDLERFGALVLGTSTWGVGELVDAWEAFVPLLDEVDLTGKRVALFGLGDQATHAESFADALGVLHDAVAARGADIVGAWPAEGYDFVDSMALRDGRFVGLVIDETSQPELTGSRIDRWVERIRGDLGR